MIKPVFEDLGMASISSSKQTISHFRLSYFITEGVVALSIIQMFLTATIPSLKVFQPPVEIALLALLVYACTTIKYDRWQVLLLATFVSVTALSLMTTTLPVFMVNAKQNGLAVLTLVYFSKAGHHSRFILPVVVVTLALLGLNKLVPDALGPFIGMAFDPQFNLSRFGGFFLNAHFNAYFLATAFIYYGSKTRFFGFDLVFLYITGSKYVLVSYLASQASKLGFIRYLTRFRLLMFLSLVLGVSFLIDNSRELIIFFDSKPFGLSLNSASVIIMQLFDPVYYKIFLNPLPAELINVSADAAETYSGHSGDIEIGYLYVASQCGVFLGTIYLFMLFRNASYYRIFIFFSLLHVPYIFSPLIIYMMIFYSKDIGFNNKKKVLIY